MQSGRSLTKICVFSDLCAVVKVNLQKGSNHDENMGKRSVIEADISYMSPFPANGQLNQASQCIDGWFQSLQMTYVTEMPSLPKNSSNSPHVDENITI